MRMDTNNLPVITPVVRHPNANLKGVIRRVRPADRFAAIQMATKYVKECMALPCEVDETDDERFDIACDAAADKIRLAYSV